MADRGMFERFITTEIFVHSFLVRDRIYVLLGNDIRAYDLASAACIAGKTLFSKKGLARGLYHDTDYLLCKDFVDFLMIDHDTLRVAYRHSIGSDLKSDICGVCSDERRIYIGVRNGHVAVIEKREPTIVRFHAVSQSSIWDMCVVDDTIYAGNVAGELLVIDTETMGVVSTVPAHRKNLKSLCHFDRFLVTSGQDMRIILWDLENMTRVAEARNAHSKSFEIVGPVEGHLLSVCYRTGEIAIWSADSLERRRTLPIARCLSGETEVHGGSLYLVSRAIEGVDRVPITEVIGS